MSNTVPTHRQLFLKFTLPVAGLMSVLLVVSLFALVAVAGYQTKIARQQQILLADGAMAIRRAQAAKTALDYGAWDDAVDNLVTKLDVTWADANIGDWTYTSLGFGMAFVVAPDGSSPYATVKGERTTRPVGSILSKGFDTLLARQRAGVPSEASSGLVLADGVPSLAVVAPIRYFTPGRTLQGEQTLLVLVDSLDAKLLGELAQSYLLPDLRVLPAGTADPAQVALKNADGEVIGALAWNGARPGDTLLRTALPLWFALTALFVLLTTLMLRQARSAARMISESEWRARHDALTLLPNRVLFFERLDAAARRAAEGGIGFGLLYMDLDGFKHINDRHGHDAGDTVLKVVAERIRAEIEGGDVVARLGGDEFSLILHGRGHPPRIQAFGQRLLREIRQPIRLGSGEEVTVGATIGVATAPGDSTDPLVLLRHADEALLLGKRSGKQQVRFHAALAAAQIG